MTGGLFWESDLSRSHFQLVAFNSTRSLQRPEHLTTKPAATPSNSVASHCASPAPMAWMRMILRSLP